MTRPIDPERGASATLQRRRAEARRRIVARRRRVGLLLVAVSAALAGALLGARGDEGGGAQEAAREGAAARPAECPQRIAAERRLLAGQMLVTRMEATATEDLRRRVGAGEIAGVILFPAPGTTPVAIRGEVAKLARAAAGGGMPPPLVAIDQEGGEVERLPELAPDVSPAELAALGDEPAAFAEGVATGRDLSRLGINVDLAPVLDLPAGPESFIFERSFGDRPAEVTALGLGFARGLEASGIAATAKHFPGLGLASVNTDEAPSTIEAPRARLAPGLEPFRAAVEAGVPLVMVANATYPAYDPARPASQSARVIEGLLRDRLGFGGVVVTDDLGAGALTGGGLDEGAAAVGAARAGADLLLLANSEGEAAAAALSRALRRGELDRSALEASCARTIALRERLAAASG